MISTKKQASNILRSAILILFLSASSSADEGFTIPSQAINLIQNDAIQGADTFLKTAYTEYMLWNSTGLPNTPVFETIQVNSVEDKVLTHVALNDGESLDPSELEGFNASLVTCGPYACTCWVPISSIPTMLELLSVKFLSAEMPFIRQQGSITNEAVVAHRLDEIASIISPGLTGAGLSIGVLSDSYNTSPTASTNEADDVSSGDLPDDVTILRDLESNQNPIDEGRAMLQLIHDIAPDAKLFFRTAFLGAQDFANGIIELADEGCDVIVDDIGYFDEPYFQDGVIARAANFVSEQRNVPYFSAAGNSGIQSYEADFVASSVVLDVLDKQCLCHQFGSLPTQNAQFINAPTGALIFLQWTDPFGTLTGPPGAANDLQLLVFNEQGNTLVDGSAVLNIGNDPIEAVALDPGRYLLTVCVSGVATATDAPSIRLKWINFGGDLAQVDPDTQSSTLFGHPNARNVAGVAAAFWQQTPEFGVSPPELEPFSSRGGTKIFFDDNGSSLATPEKRQQPRFTAVDGTSTTFFGLNNQFFFGTSAAAPNCAALALLLLQVEPNFSPIEVYTALAATAIDIDPPGYDFDSGAGLVDFFSALSSFIKSSEAPSSTPSFAPSSGPSSSATSAPITAASAAPSGAPSEVPVTVESSRPSGAPPISPVAASSDDDDDGFFGGLIGFFEMLCGI